MTYYILSKPLASESCNLSPLLYEHPQSTSSYSAPHNPPFFPGTSDSTLRTYDTRVRDGVVLEWRVATPLRSVHVIKSLLCDPAGVWVATGFSSGMIHFFAL